MVIFRDETRRKLLAASPFADVKGGSHNNGDRQRFIDVETIEKVIAAASQCSVAAARCPSLRMSNGPLAMTWADVDWQGERLTIRPAKTAYHEGKSLRSGRRRVDRKSGAATGGNGRQRAEARRGESRICSGNRVFNEC